MYWLYNLIKSSKMYLRNGIETFAHWLWRQRRIWTHWLERRPLLARTVHGRLNLNWWDFVTHLVRTSMDMETWVYLCTLLTYFIFLIASHLSGGFPRCADQVKIATLFLQGVGTETIKEDYVEIIVHHGSAHERAPPLLMCPSSRALRFRLWVWNVSKALSWAWWPEGVTQSPNCMQHTSTMSVRYTRMFMSLLFFVWFAVQRKYSVVTVA